MIIDCSLFYNEYEMAEIRVNELKDVVDKFIFISATTTFSGKPNLYPMPTQLEQLADIECQSYTIPPHLKLFEAEHWLNDRMRDIVKSYSPHDIFIKGDADEIASAELVPYLDGEYNLSMDQYYYNFHNYMRQQDGVFSFLGKNFHPRGVYPMRNNHIYPLVERAGWEFSFFGDVAWIQNKLEAYSHAELVIPEYHDAENIQHRIDNNLDIVDRYVDGNPTIELPKYVLENKERFARFW